MAENNEPGAPETPVSRVPPPLPRRNISAERQAQPPDAALNDRLSVLVDSVKNLATHLSATEGEAETEFAKDRSARRVKKFQRSGLSEERSAGAGTEEPAADVPVPTTEPVAAVASEKPDEAAFNKSVAWPRAAIAPADEESAGPASRPIRKRPGKKLIAAVVYGAGLALTVLGFLGGRLTAPEPEEEPTAKPPPIQTSESGGYFRVSERTLEAANAALHAASTGDLDRASKLYNEALDKHLELPGVHYQLARLHLRGGNPLDADLELDRSSDAGERVAECCYSRARMAATKGDYAEVVRQLQAAAHVEPFNAHYFFYWGEALRRRGQAQTAAEVFDQALAREHTVAEGELYLFKQRLAKAESGSDQAFNAELADHLKQEPVHGEWLLIAAARDIAHGAYPAAAASLQKAAAALPPAVYNQRIRDYVFQSAQDESTVSALVRRPWGADAGEGNGPFVDPMIAPVAVADPAIWPVAVGR